MLPDQPNFVIPVKFPNNKRTELNQTFKNIKRLIVPNSEKQRFVWDGEWRPWHDSGYKRRVSDNEEEEEEEDVLDSEEEEEEEDVE